MPGIKMVNQTAEKVSEIQHLFLNLQLVDARKSMVDARKASSYQNLAPIPMNRHAAAWWLTQ